MITRCCIVIRSSGGLPTDIALQDGQDQTLGGKHPDSAEHSIDLIGFEMLSEWRFKCAEYAERACGFRYGIDLRG
jgi:hypothetical protein